MSWANRISAMCALTSAIAISAASIGTAVADEAGSDAQVLVDKAKPATTDPSAQVAMGDIIVTASRRATKLHDTPIAISAYGHEQLARENIRRFDDLVTRSPNIQFGFNGTNTNVAIRGIGNGLQGAANEPGVAFHADGTYIADQGLGLATFLDVDRVEVLRGPQGTLFGRNATGGAVNIISNAPTATPKYGFTATAGIPLGEHVDGFVSGPLNTAGTVLVRTAVEQTLQQGDVRNINPIGPRRLDDKDDYGVKTQVEWLPDDRLDVRLMGVYERSHTAGAPDYYAGTVTPTDAVPAPLAGTYIAAPGADTIAVSQGDVVLEEKSATLFVNWTTPLGKISTTISRRNTINNRNYDGDGSPAVYLEYSGDTTRDTTTAETLFSTDPSRAFSVILGANYYRDNTTSFSRSYVPTVLTGPFGDALGNAVTTTSQINTEAYAVFGHADFVIIPAWKLFGGLRYSNDRKVITETGNLHPDPLTQIAQWGKITFEFGTTYKIAATANFYLKYATGFKGGGFAGGSFAPPFNPETDRMIEVGIKGTFFGGLLDANLAGFHMPYKDLQVFQITGLITRVTNAASATINGAEAELTAHLASDLRVDVDGGYLDATFDRFITSDSARPGGDGTTLNDAGQPAFNLAGNRLPSAPRLTLGGGPVYTHTDAHGGTVAVGGRYDWKSRVFFSEFNLPLVSQAPSGRLSGFADYTLPGGHWNVGIFGRNLTNVKAFGSLLVYSAVLNSMAAGTMYPGREFGIRVRFKG